MRELHVHRTAIHFDDGTSVTGVSFPGDDPLALLARARSGELVEIGCLGGHGRTGSALACLAVLTGTPPDAAVDWVRAHYCPKAVETDEQRAFVENDTIERPGGCRARRDVRAC